MQNIILFLFSAVVITLFTQLIHRYLGKSGLISWVGLLSVLANLFVLKQITLFGFEATASDVYAIGGLIALNLLQEHYGFQAAKEGIKTAFACLVCFCVFSQVQIHYIPTSYDVSNSAYTLLLQPAPRLLAASIFAYLCSQSINVWLFRTLSHKLSGRMPVVSHLLSVFVAQAFDTVLFALLGLYGLMHDIIQVILISYFIKMASLFATLPFTSFATQTAAYEK